MKKQKKNEHNLPSGSENKWNEEHLTRLLHFGTKKSIYFYN